MSVLHAETILNYLATTVLTTSATGVTTVKRNYPYTFTDTDLPALVISQVADKPIGEHGPDNLVFQDWTLEVEFLVAVKATTIPLDTTLNTYRLAIHKALMADITTNGYTYDVWPSEVVIENPKDNPQSEEPIAVMRILFSFLYRTDITDPSA